MNRSLSLQQFQPEQGTLIAESSRNKGIRKLFALK